MDQERIKQLEIEVAALQTQVQRLANQVQNQQNATIIRRGTADEDIAADGSGDVILEHNPASSLAGHTITAHLDWAHGDEQVSDGKQVFVAWIRDRWVIIGAECEAA